MNLSVLIARIMAVIYLSAAVGRICSASHYRRMVDDMFANAALTYVTGFIAVIIGSLIVAHHNTWRRDWTTLITLLGWLALIKGAVLIAFPGFVRGYATALMSGPGWEVFPYVAICAGLLFGYFGFVSGAPQRTD
jgi:hypothetical protein